MEKKVLLENIKADKLKKYINVEKIYEIFIYIMVIEIFLGGSGKLYNIPWRMMIIVFMFIFASIKIINGSELPKGLIIGLCIIFSYSFAWILIGFIKGNSLKAGVDDITNFIALIYIPILLVVSEKRRVFINIIKILKVSMIILASLTIILFLSSYILRFINIDVGAILEEFNKKTNYGLITGALYNFKFARVYFMNGLFMQFSLVFFIYDILNYGRKRDYLRTLIILLGVFSSSTRGYWIGAAIVILLLIFLVNKIQRKKLFKIVIICLIVSSPIMFTKVFKTEVIDRIISITDFSEDTSNKVRNIQINSMLTEIKKDILIGDGFGANLIEYQEKTGLSGRNFEVYYLELIYKTGIVGFLIISSILCKQFYCMFKDIILNKSNVEKDREYSVALTIGVISCFITGLTNPYMQGTIGIFTVSCFSAGYFIFNENTKYIKLNSMFNLFGEKSGKN